MVHFACVTIVAIAMLARNVAADAGVEAMSTWESLMQNVLSYALVVVPAVFLVRWLKQHPEKMTGSGMLPSALRWCVEGVVDPPEDAEMGEKPEVPEAVVVEESLTAQALKLAFHVGGLQGSYLTWGVLQEHIMTQTYGKDDESDGERFTNSQFLVFANRILAFCVAYLICRFTVQPKHTAPMFKYSFPSMANIMSSWCQYEALKYVTFPTQVLAKSSKMIPVMIMGRFVQNKTYPLYEYACAVGISMGVSLFMFSRASEKGVDMDEEESTSFMGAILLVGYMIFDSFTSNYQAALFPAYKMSSYQMMFGVNLFSCFFTLWSLIQNGTLLSCFEFAGNYPAFLMHLLLLSLTSATGQIFIFKTISTYGALVFTIIMTTRQVISIGISALLFGHSFAVQGLFGILIVFIAMFARIYLKTKSKPQK